MRGALLVVLVGAALGCGGGGPQTHGTLGLPSMARVTANVILVDAALDGHPGGHLLADTGAPFTLVDANGFAGAPVDHANSQIVVDLTFGAITIEHVSAINVREPAVHVIAGIVGGDVMRDFSTAFDYRGMSLRFGDGAAPADVAQPGAVVPFTLQGGGKAALDPSTSIDYPATRVPVTVELDGVARDFILDTGASEVTLRSGLFTSLVGDGRPVLHGLTITTVSGAMMASASRARTVRVGGEQVADVAVLSGADAILDAVSEELGRPIDGLLGGTFLREFFVTLDYPHGELHLQRYATRDHIADEFQRAGLALGASTPNGYAISAVYAGTQAAALGLAVGDEVQAIDGQALAAIDVAHADALLQGTPGATHLLRLGSAAGAGLSGTSIEIPVEDLIPAP